MNKAFVLLFYAAALGGCLLSQLDLLTYREAESIVERIPDVVSAQKEGHCPILLGAYDGAADEVSFRVRIGCGPTRGQLVGTYKVNRRTGRVTLWGDDPVPVGDREGRRLAERLMIQAHGRILSADESKCLALEAAKGLPGWSSDDSFVSVESLGSADPGQVRFTALNRSSRRPVESARTLTLRLGTAHVRDDDTGEDVISERLGALTSKILALRAPLWLTDEDSLLIALQIPSLAAGVRGGCRLYTAGPFRSEETEVGVGCDGKQKEGAAALVVNLRTGKTTDARTGKPLESAESLALARRLLDEKAQIRSALRKEAEAACVQK
jgi:hypothetical protein